MARQMNTALRQRPRKVKDMNRVLGKEEDEPESRIDSEDEALEDAVRDFAEGERLVKLYRYPGELGGRPRFLGGLAPEEFNEVHIQEVFGGGRYFGRWRRADGYYKRLLFEIDGEAKILTKAAAAAVEQKGHPYEFLDRENNEEGATSQALSTSDVLALIAETRREAREEMRMLLEMMRPGQQAQAPTEQVFSLVEKIVPLIQGGGDGGNPWLAAIAQLKEPLAKIVDTISVAVTRASPVRANPPLVKTAMTPGKTIHTPAPQSPVHTEQQSGETMMLLKGFEGFMPILLSAAKQGRDVSAYTEIILDSVPVFAYDRVLQWLETPGCLDGLAKLDKTVYDYSAWFDALRMSMIQALRGENDTFVQSPTDTNASGSTTTLSDSVD